MWRINNILLCIFLIFSLSAGGYVFYYDHLSYIDWDWGKSAKERQKRELNAAKSLDENGQQVRTHMLSYSQTLSPEGWGDWNAVLIQQTALENPVQTNETGDQVVITRSRNGLADMAPRWAPYANNIVIRNATSGEQRILFDKKSAVVRFLPVIKAGAPGLAVVFVDEDANGDGKLTDKDKFKLRLFRFDSGEAYDIPFTGIFPSFLDYERDAPVFGFTTYLDLNEDGEAQPNLEPAVLYEVDVESGATRQALKPDTVSALQAIIDGGTP